MVSLVKQITLAHPLPSPPGQSVPVEIVPSARLTQTSISFPNRNGSYSGNLRDSADI